MQKLFIVAFLALLAPQAIAQTKAPYAARLDPASPLYARLPPNTNDKNSTYWELANSVNLCITKSIASYDDNMSDAQTVAKFIGSECANVVNLQTAALIVEYEEHREQLKVKDGDPIWEAGSDRSAAEATVAANYRILKEILSSRVQRNKSKWFWQR